jgi:hypothetical protein
MQGSKPSKTGRKQWLRAIGGGAAILVVAGGLGVPFNVVAAMALGAAVVLIVDP